MDTPTLPPLTHAELYILLALARKDRDGAEIKAKAASYSEGAVILKPGTLYETIHRLQQEKLIETAPAADTKSDDSRRKYYRITNNGKQVLGWELKRLEQALHRAKGLRL